MIVLWLLLAFMAGAVTGALVLAMLVVSGKEPDEL